MTVARELSTLADLGSIWPLCLSSLTSFHPTLASAYAVPATWAPSLPLKHSRHALPQGLCICFSFCLERLSHRHLWWLLPTSPSGLRSNVTFPTRTTGLKIEVTPTTSYPFSLPLETISPSGHHREKDRMLVLSHPPQ